MSSRTKSKKKNAPPATAPVAAALAPWERRWLCAIVLLGLLLRWAGMSGLAVEHFDEGVYAANLYCGHLDPPYAYPMRHLYAPPLFPALLEWAQVFWKAEATMWVNVLLGGLTVVAVWYATRCWFGRSAALAAAILAATGEFHIAFSRMALTDVPLSLFLLAGVFAGWRAIVSGRPAWVVAAGVLAGLAWCTKYNGWLTLAITGSGMLAWFFAKDFVPKFLLRADEKGTAAADNAQISNLKSEISNRKHHVAGSVAGAASANCTLGTAVARWGISAAIASSIFWFFVVRELAPLGGYAAVAKNHAGYFVGLAGWWSGFLRQGAAHDLLMGWPTCIGVAAAWWMCGAIGLRTGGDVTSPRRWVLMGLIGLAAALAARLLTASGLLAIAALIGFVYVQRSTVVREEAASSSDPAAANLAAWLLCAWFFGLLVSVPLYYPYPRLSVPWVVVCWPLAGAAIAALANPKSRVRESRDAAAPAGGPPTGSPKSESGVPGRNPKFLVAAGIAVVVMIGLTIAFGRVSAPLGAWRSRVLIEDIAQRMLPEIESAAADTGTESGSGIAAIVYVAGDPAAFYQLSAACSNPRIAFQPIAEADGLRPTADVPTFLVSRETANAPNRDVPGLRMIASNRFKPSDMVLLDRMPAADVRRQGGLPTDQLRLYRIGGEDSGFGIQDSEKAAR